MNMKGITWGCAYGICLLVNAGDSGDQKKEDTDDRFRYEVTVTSKEEKGFTCRLKRRMTERPLVESSGLETSTSIIGRDEIEATDAFSVVDAMEYTVGAWTEQRGRKTKAFFSVRGQRYPYPSYSLDGAWFREFLETNYFLSAANIERIEIIRSSAALLHSPEGMAGIVELTPRTYTTPETELELLYGSDNLFQSQISHGAGGDDFDYALGIGFFHTDGPDDENASENISNFYNRMAFHIADDLTLSLTSFMIYGDRELQLAEEPALAVLHTREESFDPMKMYGVIFKVDYEPDDQTGTEFTMNYANRRLWGHRDGTTHWLEEDYEYGANLIQSVGLSDANTLRVGGSFNYWRCPTGKRYYVGRAAELSTYSGVIVDEHKFGDLTMDLGYRISRTHIEEFGGFSVEGSASGLTSILVEDEWEDPVHTVSLGGSCPLTDQVALHMNLSWGQVASQLGMLNADLEKPGTEERTKIDFGIMHKLDIGELVVSSFMIHQNDAALVSSSKVTVDGIDYALYETGERKSYGFEVDYHSPRTDFGLQGFLNGIAMRTHRTTAGSWELDKEVPEYIANAGISQIVSDWECLVFVKHVSSYENDRFLAAGSQPAPLGDYTETNAKLIYHFSTAGQFFIGVDNIGDKKYSTVAGYPDEGRQYYAGVRYKF